MLHINKLVINESVTGSIQSEIVDISSAEGVCLHSVWTGTLTGNIILSGSNSLNPSDFVTITSQATGGSPGKILFNVEKAHYCYVKVDYVHTSGSGSLKCFISAKKSR